jgi:hypothetical protein
MLSPRRHVRCEGGLGDGGPTPVVRRLLCWGADSMPDVPRHFLLRFRVSVASTATVAATDVTMEDAWEAEVRSRWGGGVHGTPVLG